MNLDRAALEFVRRICGSGAQATEIAGDASTRRFYRVSGIGPASTAVLMAHGEPLTTDAPLYSNHRILDAIGAPVPRLLAREDRLGLVLMEDFGDLSLQQRLLAEARQVGRQAEGAADQHGLYARAIDLIVLMQGRAPEAIRPDDFAARNALDRERFLFELGHFEKHFIRGLRRLTPTPAEEAILAAFYDDLAGACDRLPRVYCHRDYQSRNLLVRPDGRLGLIDFQDARMGPYTYDAASLLRDSSLDLDESLVSGMLDRLATACAASLAIGREELRHDFDLVALQRNIKDLGTFGYMATVRARPDYLEYVPRTQASIRRTMLADRRWHDAFGPLLRLALDPATAGRA